MLNLVLKIKEKITKGYDEKTKVKVIKKYSVEHFTSLDEVFLSSGSSQLCGEADSCVMCDETGNSFFIQYATTESFKYGHHINTYWHCSLISSSYL